MFFWITSNTRCSLTHGIGYKQLYNTSSRFIVSRSAIIRIAMIIALFLPMSRTQFYHHKISDDQDYDQNPRLNEYHYFYDNMPSSNLASNLQFRHHKMKKKLGLFHKKHYEFDKTLINTAESTTPPELEVKLKHQNRLKKTLKLPQKYSNNTRNMIRWAKRNPGNKNGKTEKWISGRDIEPAEPIRVLVGNTVIIPCKKGIGILSAGIVSWKYTNGKPVTSDRFTVETNGNLVITNAKPNDSKVYTCKIENNEQAESVLEVYQPKIPALEINLQLEMGNTEYPIFIESDECKTSELSTLKRGIKENLSDLCKNKKCIIIDFRISCQFKSDKFLDVRMIMAGELTNEIINICEDKECMENNMADALIGAKEELQYLLAKSSKTHEERSTEHRKKLLETRSITTCDEGEGLEDDKCMPCKPGYYSIDGPVDCIKCKPGTYQPDHGSTQCLNCDGDWSKAGSTSCRQKIIVEISSNDLKTIIPLIIAIILSISIIAWTLYMITSSIMELRNG